MLIKRLAIIAVLLVILIGAISCAARASKPPVQEPIPAGVTIPVDDPLTRGTNDGSVPGFYCNSCGSSSCRAQCVSSDAVGAHNRFHWCEIMTSSTVDDTAFVTNWITANYAAGLRSVVGFSAKTDRNVDFSGVGSCTNASDGSPSFMLSPSSVYSPLVNGTGSGTYYHLNYKDADVQARFDLMLSRVAIAINGLPVNVRNSVEIEANIGNSGELTAACNYNNYPPSAPLGWMDRDMYICSYAGDVWHPAITDQYCTRAGVVIDPLTQSGASTSWRDDVMKPMVDLYIDSMSTEDLGKSRISNGSCDN